MQITCLWHQLEDVPRWAITLLLLNHCVIPSEGQVPPSHGVTTAGLHYPQALSQTSLPSPSLDGSVSLPPPRELAGECRQQSRGRLWDAPGSLPFAARGVMEDYPPASHSRVGSHSALSPQSNLYWPALKHSICSPPCHQNKSFLLCSQVCLYCREGTHPRVSSCPCCSNGLLSSVSLRPV